MRATAIVMIRTNVTERLAVSVFAAPTIVANQMASEMTKEAVTVIAVAKVQVQREPIPLTC